MCGKYFLYRLLDNRFNYYKKSQKLSNATALGK